MTASLPTATERSVADMSRDAELCATVLGAPLTAYIAGADSVDEYRRWLSGDGEARSRIAPRLAAVRRVITVFRAENWLSMVRPWLREAGAAGDIPARVIRDKGDDEAISAMVAEAASQWLRLRQPPSATPE
jgi:hypothetical protein